ncbi:protein O-mannosyl-transferase TMTC2-like isoform X1 [Macrosteles quadrilineatus]|uniref:protein O-mannosyl-transferase TMTC2-like isoform X1 n=2 Tax=Macrosteles quadrilineatus TaxID=74068 RepID=UPI0023E2A379|nr:protein O-mannosyl-transferase TMTC2-like isoform X1 [Macrosteles quadrilineatus]
MSSRTGMMGLGRWDLDGLAVCFLSFVVYINTLGHGFVYDDHRAILTNPDVLPSSSIFQVFHNDFWGTPLSSSSSHGSFRPIAVLSFRLNVWASGLRPFGFHATNVLLHTIASTLVMKTARVFLPGRSPTLAAALFAVHPIHVEAVAGIVGRADILSAIFFLMSFLFYVNYVKVRDSALRLNSVKFKSVKGCAVKTQNGSFCVTRSSLYLQLLGKITFPKSETFFYTLFFVFAVLAVLCKEPAVTVIPVAVCYDVILHLRSTKLKHHKWSSPPSASASMIAFFSIILTRLLIMGLKTPSFSKADNPIAKDGSLITRTLSFLYLPLFNFILLLFPKSLSFDWSMDAIPRVQSLFEYRFVFTIAFYALLFRSIKVSLKSYFPASKHFSKPKNCCKTCQHISEPHISSCRLYNNNNNPIQKCVCLEYLLPLMNRRSAGMLCLVFIALPFIPAANIFFYVGFVVAERVLYIPSIGFCLLVALGSHVLYTNGRKSLVLVCCFLLLTAFATKTLQRNRDWKDDESLYRSATSVNPAKAYGNLGSVLSSAGRLQEAEQALRLALHYRPNMADVHYNLGNLLNRQNKFQEAVESYESAIKYRPSLAVAYLNLGQTLESLTRFEEAEEHYVKCLQLDTEGLKDPRAHEEAKKSCLHCLKRLCGEKSCGDQTSIIIQEQSTSRKDLGDLSKNDNFKLTKKHVENLSLNDNHFHTVLKNRTAISREEERYLHNLQSSPNNPANYVSYGQLLVKQGRKGEAASLYLRAAQLQPQHHSLVISAAVALRHAGRLGEAEAMYRQARELRPQDATSHSNLGAILHLQGKYQQAASSYREALRLTPGDRVTLANLQKLNNLLSRNKR